MKKIFYCSQCGTPLEVFRKAFRGNILNLIPPHDCQDVREPDFEPLELPPAEVQKSDEFVQKLNDLRSPPPPMPDLRDRRPADVVKSTAPEGVIDSFSSIQHSIPTGPVEDIEDEVS